VYFGAKSWCPTFMRASREWKKEWKKDMCVESPLLRGFWWSLKV